MSTAPFLHAFQLVEAATAAELETVVNEKLNVGYVLAGSVQVVYLPDARSESLLYIQPMAKPGPAPELSPGYSYR